MFCDGNIGVCCSGKCEQLAGAAFKTCTAVTTTTTTPVTTTTQAPIQIIIATTTTTTAAPTNVCTTTAVTLEDFSQHGAVLKLMHMATILLATLEIVMLAPARQPLQQPHHPQLAQHPASFPSSIMVLSTTPAPTQEDSKIHGVVLKLMPLENTLLATMPIVELDVLWRFLVRMKYFLHLKVS